MQLPDVNLGDCWEQGDSRRIVARLSEDGGVEYALYRRFRIWVRRNYTTPERTEYTDVFRWTWLFSRHGLSTAEQWQRWQRTAKQIEP